MFVSIVGGIVYFKAEIKHIASDNFIVLEASKPYLFFKDKLLHCEMLSSLGLNVQSFRGSVVL